MISRRQCLQWAAASPLLPTLGANAIQTVASLQKKLPANLPVGISTIISGSLQRNPSSINTDWFGSLLMQGLLQWSRRGISEIKDFSLAWLDYHWNAKTVSTYSGPASRVFLAGKIPLTTYAGHYSLAFPCYELATQFAEPRARQACLDIARMILHRASRNRLGMVNHDDNAVFAIPDTCYFVVSPLMMASKLGIEDARIYQEQALIQLRIYTDTFLIRETGLVRTILYKDGLGKTYWTRAAGWLLWSMLGVLRHLPPSAPEMAGFLADLKILAEGLARVQGAGGGFHVLLDEPASPLETTGSIMIATGLHESIQRGWLPSRFNSIVASAWQFAKKQITPDGQILQAYTGWAVPAENREMSMDEHKMEWIPGFVLSAASLLS